MASKRRNMFQKNKTQETTENGRAAMDTTGSRYSSPSGTLFVEDNLTFKRKGGCFVAKSSAMLALLAVVVLLVATALITRHLTKQQYEKENIDANEGYTGAKPLARLTTDVIPLHYKLMLEPYLDHAPEGKQSFQMTGRVKIILKTKKPVSSIEIHGVGLNFTSDQVKLMKIDTVNTNSSLPENQNWTEFTSSDNSKLRNILVNSVMNNTLAESHTISFEKSTELNSFYLLEINYTASMYISPEGISISKFMDNQRGTERWFAVSHFEPTNARKAFPCFDEPEYKATFDISIFRASNMSSLSNMEIESEDNRGNGWVWDHYQTTPPMSTHLLAIVVFDFQNWKYTDGSVNINFWFRQGIIENSTMTYIYVQELIQFYSSYFNSTYTLPKIDIVVAPEVPAIITDSWGLLKMSESVFLGLSRPSIKSLLTLSHKLAQQWLGNLVTVKWWNDVWLMESLAHYLQYIATVSTSQRPLTGLFVKNELQPALIADSLNSTHALYSEPLNSTDILEYYDDSSFKKGAALLSMLSNIMGETVFQNGIRQFLREWAMKNIEAADLWSAMTKVIPKNSTLRTEFGDNITVLEIMRSWVDIPGYPVLNTTYNSTSGNLHFYQEKFGPCSNKSSNVWRIPVSYIFKDGANYGNFSSKNIWVNKISEENIIVGNHSEDNWVLVRPLSKGFYRVNYDENNWYLLMKEMKEKNSVLLEQNKVQLIDDAFQLAKIGKLSYDIPLNMTTYLINNESDFLPWHTAWKNLRFLKLFFWNSQYYPLLYNYIMHLVQPTFLRQGNTLAGKGQTQTMLEHLVQSIACSEEIPECLKKAKEAFGLWKYSAEPEFSDLIDYGMRTAFCVGVRHGDKSEAEFMFHTYVNLTSKPLEQSEILKALTCSTKPWVIKMLLTESIKNNSIFKTEDVKILWSSFSENFAAAEAAFEFFEGNWKNILARYMNNPDVMKTIISKVSSSLSSEHHLRKLVELRDNMKLDDRSGKWQLEKAIENLQFNADWRVTQMPSVISWLRWFNNDFNQ